MEPSVWSLIGTGVTTAGAIVIALINRRKKKKQASDTADPRPALNVARVIQNYAQVATAIRALRNNSELDRYILFKAENGAAKPTHTSSLDQIREPATVTPFIHVSLDQDYTDRLYQLERDGYAIVTTATLADCRIKEIYELEGVKEALWARVATLRLGTKVIRIYCSFATLSDQGLTPNTVARCRLITDQLQGVFEV